MFETCCNTCSDIRAAILSISNKMLSCNRQQLSATATTQQLGDGVSIGRRQQHKEGCSLHHNMHANLQARASEKQITEQAKRNSIQLAGKAFIAIAQLTSNKREP